MSSNDDTKCLVWAITDFLRRETQKTDMSEEDMDTLRTSVECLERVYGLHNACHPTYTMHRRSLLDMYSQFANPVTIRDKVKAEISKTSGNAKMANDMFQEAEEDYTRAIELDRWNSVYYCNRAAARIELGRYHEAVSDCRTAVELNPDYAKAYARMGLAYDHLDKPGIAISCFRQAAMLEPENPHYRSNVQRRAARRTNSGLDGVRKKDRKKRTMFHSAISDFNNP